MFCFYTKTIWGIQILTWVNYFCYRDTLYKAKQRKKRLIWVESITQEGSHGSRSMKKLVIFIYGQEAERDG